MLSAAVQGVCDLLGCYRLGKVSPRSRSPLPAPSLSLTPHHTTPLPPYRLGKALDPDAVSRALAVYIDEEGQQVLKIKGS